MAKPSSLPFSQSTEFPLKSVWEQAFDIRKAFITGVFFVIAWLMLFGPVYFDFAKTVWAREGNDYPPFILAICAGLAYARISSGVMEPRKEKSALWVGVTVLFLGLGAFLFARVQEIEFLLSLTQLIVALGTILMVYGYKGVRKLWFVLALSLYLIAWPGWAIDMLTFPLKLFVSQTVSNGLYSFGLPISHQGATLNVGAYELLVANACAGVNSLIALTSVGIVYLYMVKRPSLRANLFVLAMLVPIAILANMIRVAILVLITYYGGYDAGQNFLHDLSGMVMFGVAIASVFLLDSILVKVAR